MDLDKIKENWKDIRPTIREEEIYKILNKKGKTALGRLKTVEVIGLILLFLLIPFPFVYNEVLVIRFTPAQQWYYTIFCIIGFFWQLYKLNLLNKIKPEKIDIHTSLRYITSYKQYIRYEIVISLTWAMIFFAWFTITIIHTDKLEEWWWLVGMVTFFAILTVGLSILLYNVFIKRNTKKIESSLQEIKEFESENEQ